VPRGFRAAAEQRISELEQRDRERQVRAEEGAVRERAAQRAERERRERAQQTEATQADAEHRARLAQRFGQQAADRVNLHGEYHLFTVGHRNVAAAYARPAEAHHPGGHAPRRTPAPAVRSRGASWDHQLALQRGLGVGVDPPVIVYGDKLADAAANVDRLLIDPSDTDLRSYA
jgi:hypothetical protein